MRAVSIMRLAPSTSGTPLANWTTAGGVGLAGVALHWQMPGLVDPARCSGLLELISVAAVRAMPSAPLATVFHMAGTASTFVALTLVVRALQVCTGSLLRSAAAGLGLAASSLFTPVLAPPGALALATAAATLLAMVRSLDRETAPRLAIALTALGLATVAAMAPPLAAPLALVAGLAAWLSRSSASAQTRAAIAAAVAIGVAVAPFAVALVLPAVPTPGPGVNSTASCVLPSPALLSAHVWMLTAGNAFSSVGAFVVSLAALGAFASRALLQDRRAWPAIALVLVPALAAFRSDVEVSLPVVAPLVIGFWWLVAVGLGEIAAATRDRALGRIAAALFVGAVPLLQLAALRDPAVPRFQPFGHETLSNTSFGKLVRLLPPGTRLVEEDAITDILIRSAAPTSPFAAKQITVMARTAEVISPAVENGYVLAMPRAQSELLTKGLRVVDSGLRARGVSRVAPGGACGTATSGWTDVPGLASSDRIALVVDRAEAYGHIVVYLSSDHPLAPRPINWPDAARRGYFVDVYDRSVARDRQRLEDDAAADKAPRPHPAIDAPVVTRLELWRVPGAPLDLVIGLDRPPVAALTRAVPGTDERGLHVCPAFEHAPARLDVR